MFLEVYLQRKNDGIAGSYKITVNGINIDAPNGSSVSVSNGNIFIDDQKVDVFDEHLNNPIINITITGPVTGKVETDSGEIIIRKCNLNIWINYCKAKCIGQCYI